MSSSYRLLQHLLAIPACSRLLQQTYLPERNLAIFRSRFFEVFSFLFNYVLCPCTVAWTSYLLRALLPSATQHPSSCIFSELHMWDCQNKAIFLVVAIVYWKWEYNESLPPSAYRRSNMVQPGTARQFDLRIFRTQGDQSQAAFKFPAFAHTFRKALNLHFHVMFPLEFQQGKCIAASYSQQTWKGRLSFRNI